MVIRVNLLKKQMNLRHIAVKREKYELYFILVLYTFIKVKSNEGEKGDGCAKTYWVQSFSLFDATMLNR